MTLQALETNAHGFTSDPITDEEGAAMLRAVLYLFGKWAITDEEAATLLDLPVRTYRRWKAGRPGRLDRDTKARLSNLLGIHKALRILFMDPARGYDWIRVENAAFGEKAPLASCWAGS